MEYLLPFPSKNSIVITAILSIFLFFPTLLLPQSQPRATLTGHVTDAATGEPLPGANVFLAGTTRGDASDKNGHYLIPNIPPGTYELVVSMMGYEAQKQTIALTRTADFVADFSLQPKILQGEEVVVTADDAKAWRKNLQIFERAFFGVKDFAKECKLLNPEVLDFDYDRDSGHFRATAEQPLRFVNNALGYEVTFIMQFFNALLRNDELYSIDVVNNLVTLQKGSRKWIGSMVFSELTPRSKDEREKWRKNRRIAYNGSQRHFFKTLCEDRLKQEGFAMWGVERGRVLGEYHYRVKPADLLRLGKAPDERLLSLPHMLKVVYKNEKNEVDLRFGRLLLDRGPSYSLDSYEKALLKIEAECMQQASWLVIDAGKSLTIATDGVILLGSEARSTFGYWGFDGPDEWLPREYRPEQ